MNVFVLHTGKNSPGKLFCGNNHVFWMPDVQMASVYRLLLKEVITKSIDWINIDRL